MSNFNFHKERLKERLGIVLVVVSITSFIIGAVVGSFAEFKISQSEQQHCHVNGIPEESIQVNYVRKEVFREMERDCFGVERLLRHTERRYAKCVELNEYLVNNGPRCE